MKKPAGLFTQRIWELALSIPPGRVTTYGALARAAGGGGQAARSVSGILAKAPKSYQIPWHRIVYSDGHVWKSSEHDVTRKKLYKKEGIKVNEKGKIINFSEILLDL